MPTFRSESLTHPLQLPSRAIAPEQPFGLPPPRLVGTPSQPTPGQPLRINLPDVFGYFCSMRLFRPGITCEQFEHYVCTYFQNERWTDNIVNEPGLFFPVDWLAPPDKILLDINCPPHIIEFLQSLYRQTHISIEPFPTQSPNTLNVVARINGFTHTAARVIGFVYLCGYYCVLVLCGTVVRLLISILNRRTHSLT